MKFTNEHIHPESYELFEQEVIESTLCDFTDELEEKGDDATYSPFEYKDDAGNEWSWDTDEKAWVTQQDTLLEE